MKTASAVWLALSLCLVSTSAQGEPRPTRIAVVDVVRAFEELDEKATMEAELADMGRSFQTERERRAKRLQELRADLDVLKTDSPAYRKTLAEIERLVIELRVLTTHQAKRLHRERANRTEQLYRRLLTGIAHVADDQKFDLVLFKEREPNFKDATSEQVATLIQVRKVLWHHDALDLTDAVVTRVNVAFRNARGKPRG